MDRIEISINFHSSEAHGAAGAICHGPKISLEEYLADGEQEMKEMKAWERKQSGAEIEILKGQKNQAYAERNQLVAALSKLFRSSLVRHEGEDWEDDWRWVVLIELPTGQCSWHIHDSELPLFDHLSRNHSKQWDGHTTEEKYDRLNKLPLNMSIVAPNPTS